MNGNQGMRYLISGSDAYPTRPGSQVPAVRRPHMQGLSARTGRLLGRGLSGGPHARLGEVALDEHLDDGLGGRLRTQAVNVLVERLP